MATLRQVAGSLLDLMYPPRCLGCGGFLHDLADDRTLLLHAGCANRLPFDHKPAQRLYTAPHLEGVYAPFAYSQLPVQRAVHALKYKGSASLAAPLARHIALAVRATDFAPDADTIIACPLHWRRWRQRGFNQSALLADAVAAVLGLGYIADVPPAVAAGVVSEGLVRQWQALRAGVALRPATQGGLLRVRDTLQQARMANKRERANNVADAFVWWGDTATVAGKRVIVLDDVRTTGATLDACAVALHAAGAAGVWGLTFAC